MTRDWRWAFRRVFRLPTSATRARELDDELRFHIEGRADELMERENLSRADAEAEARRRFGDIEAYRRETRSIDRTLQHRRDKMELIDTIRRETGHALHSLLRAPSFSIIVFTTLTLGLGASTAIFTLLDRVVLRPLPYANADRLLHLGTRWPKMKADLELNISTFMFYTFKKSSKTLENVGLYRESAVPLPAGDGHDAEHIPTATTSASLFDVLGVHAEIGSLYSADDERVPSPHVAVLSHELWQRRFGGDRGIVGRTIDIGQASVRVVGVLPAGVKLPDASPLLWLPEHLNPSDPPRNWHTFKAIGLMKPGVTPDQASAELSTLTSQIIAAYPNVYDDDFMTKTGFAFFTRPLRDQVVGPRVVRALWIVFASVGIVLLIAAANVANLFLVRIDGRRREVAVRTALGAGRAHLAAHYLAESCLLALAAAGGAIAVANGLLRVTLGLTPSTLPRLEEVVIDGRSVLFCVVMSLVAAVVFGLMPLAQSTMDVGALRDGSRSLTSSRTRAGVRQLLIVTQVALAAVLLACAGLMLRSFERLHAVRSGFDADAVLTMSISLPQRRYGSEAQIVAFWHALQSRVERLPGVTGVGAAEAVPLDGSNDGCTALSAPESPLEQSQRYQCLPTTIVSPGYLRTMRIPVTGHEPDWSDDEHGAGSMVVSRSLAERMWPGQSAIGKTLVYSVRRPLSFTITGIAEDVRSNGLQKPPVAMTYFPIAAPAAAGPARFVDMNVDYLKLVVRSSRADFTTLGAEIRRIVTELDPRVPLADVQPMRQIVAKSIAQTSFTMMLMLLSAFIALSLSAAGIYGVISYVVGQRRSEIGIRVALGAQARDVSMMVVRQSMVLAVAGIAIGVVVALMSSRLLGSLLFEVSPTDPAILASSCFVLIAVAAVASVGPARRATRIDPVEAMRA